MRDAAGHRDRLTDHGFEWEVVTRPAHMHGGKTVRVRIVRPGIPETERDMTWSAHERVEIRPAVSTVTPSGSARAAR